MQTTSNAQFRQRRRPWRCDVRRHGQVRRLPTPEDGATTDRALFRVCDDGEHVASVVSGISLTLLSDAAVLRRNPRAVDWLVGYVDVDLNDTPILYAAVNSAGVR